MGYRKWVFRGALILTILLLTSGVTRFIQAHYKDTKQTGIFARSYAPAREVDAKIRTNEREYLKQAYNAQEITVMTQDGLQVRGMLIKRDKATRTVLLCHGYRMCKEAMQLYFNAFPQDNLIIFDMRAHGQSQGDYISFGEHEYKDVLSFIKFIQSDLTLKSTPVIGFGVSMGALTLAHAAVARPGFFKALILDSAMTSFQDALAQRFKRYSSFVAQPLSSIMVWASPWLMGFKVDTVTLSDLLQRLDCPFLMIHARTDKVTSFKAAYQAFAKVRGSINKFWSVDDAQHTFIAAWYPAEYKSMIEEWLNALSQGN